MFDFSKKSNLREPSGNELSDEELRMARVRFTEFITEAKKEYELVQQRKELAERKGESGGDGLNALPE